MTVRTCTLLILALAAIGLGLIACSNEGPGGSSSDAATVEADGRGPGTSTPDAGMRPVVILVHGWAGSPREMSPLKSFLDANGFHSFIAILPGDDNVANAEYLQDFVREVEDLTDVPAVNIVGFSMGGLSARQYIRFLDGSAKVSRYVSIDTPHYGDAGACLLPAESGGQMCPFSPFLSDLNRGDDTPGDVMYTTILNQRSSSLLGRLRGGARELWVDGDHGELLKATPVHQAVLAGLRG